MSRRRRYGALIPIFSLLAVIACDVALNPQPLPPESTPGDGGFSSATTSDSGGSRQEPVGDPNAAADAAGGGHDGGIPPVSPQLDGGDAGDASLDAGLDADAN